MFRKNCVFFTIHCHPSLAYNAVRDPQSSQRNASVQSLLLAGSFVVQPSAGGGEVANFLGKILGKNTMFNEHPVVDGTDRKRNIPALINVSEEKNIK